MTKVTVKLAMRKLKKPVLLAKIGAPHGVRGELRLSSFTQDPYAFADYGPLFTREGQQFTVQKARPAKNVFVVNFKEVNSREAAENLKGLELFVEREAIPNDQEEDEFFVSDLIGAAVKDENQNIVGKITAIPNFGAGDLLEIAPLLDNGRFGSKTWYLVFSKENVPHIDLENNCVVINPPNETSERDEEPDD